MTTIDTKDFKDALNKAQELYGETATPCLTFLFAALCPPAPITREEIYKIFSNLPKTKESALLLARAVHAQVTHISNIFDEALKDLK